jgi:hypothetical protein
MLIEMNDKKTRCRYELNDESVKNILDDILASEHIVFDDSNFETLFSKYLWVAMEEFYCRQKLLEVIWKN